MPKVFRRWSLLLFVLVSPMGWTAEAAPASKPLPKPPVQPSAAFLEFIGEWTDSERELLMMKDKPAIPAKADKAPEKHRAR